MRKEHAVTGDSSKRRLSRDEILAMASDLIAIPSPSGTEVTIMQWVTDWCEKHDLAYEILAKNPSQPNVIITVGNDDGPTLVMNGHLDTVPISDPDAWISGPYEPRISDDGKKIFGRGASDMKSSTGIMMLLVVATNKAVEMTLLKAYTSAETVGYFAIAGALTKGAVEILAGGMARSCSSGRSPLAVN